MPSLKTVFEAGSFHRLKELGLTTHEALTYIVLLTHPNVTASTLCRETNIPGSKIYYALAGLSKKGMLLVQQGCPERLPTFAT